MAQQLSALKTILIGVDEIQIPFNGAGLVGVAESVIRKQIFNRLSMHGSTGSG